MFCIVCKPVLQYVNMTAKLKQNASDREGFSQKCKARRMSHFDFIDTYRMQLLKVKEKKLHMNATMAASMTNSTLKCKCRTKHAV